MIKTIQQVTRSTVPQNSKASQIKNPANAFDTFMELATLGRDLKSTAQTDAEPGEEETKGGKAVSEGNLPVFNTADVSLLSQLLSSGQFPSVVPEPLQVLPQAMTADPVLSADTVQQLPAGSGLLQQVRPQAETATPLLTAADTLSQTAVNIPAPGNAPQQATADAASSVSAADAQETSCQNEQTQSVPIPAAAGADASEQTAPPMNRQPGVNPSQQIPVSDAAAAVSVQSPAQPREKGLPAQQTFSEVQAKPGTEKTLSAPTVEIQPKHVSPADDRDAVPADGQSQNTAQFSDLYRTGNVVIKVSDAPSDTARTTSKQVADQILVNYKAGKPEFQMDLYPRDLGKVSVKLAMQSGVLTVSIQASNPRTQSMLMENSSDIRTLLQTTVTQPVQISEPAQEKAWYQQDQQGRQDQAQQQQEEQQHNQQLHRVGLRDDDTSTGDFLSVMQLLKRQAYSL
ncbi:flagellar hook-length control protein FliK [Caproiciproducens sp.]